VTEQPSAQARVGDTPEQRERSCWHGAAQR